MHAKCDRCGLPFEREGGFYLGSIYVNYGLTAMIVIIVYFSLYFASVMPQQGVLIMLTAFCFLFPLWFFRYARAIWLGFDQYWDPRQD